MADSASADAGKIERRRQAKGRRPYFFDDPNVDRLLAIVTALAGEVAVLRQRLKTHEQLAAEKDVFSTEAVDHYRLGDAENEEMAAWRSEFLSRVFRILEFDVGADKNDAEERDYMQMIARFAREQDER
jgi:hypothetical protein